MTATTPTALWRHMLLLLVLLLASLALPVAESRAEPELRPRDCVAALPTSAAVPGLRGTGWTVARGRTPVPFRAEVIGVLRDGLLPGRHLIVAEVTGPAIDAAGGVWAGMSGSPVYVQHDGQQRLLGAVAYGFTWSASPVVGLTPGADLASLLASDLPVTAADVHPPEVIVQEEFRSAIADQVGVRLAQVPTELTRLPVPLSVSGLSANRLSRVRERAERAELGLLPLAGSSRAATTAATAPLRPGDNLAVTLSYGDVTIAAVGTVAATCQDRAVGFGHTLFGLPRGEVALGANQAEVLTVVSDALGGPFKLSAVGARSGTMHSDRFAGAQLQLGGALQTVPITARVTDLRSGRSRTGRTDAVDVEWLADVALLHVAATVDTVTDRVGPGNATTEVELRGRLEDGRPWRISREDRFASEWDIASELSWAVFGDLIVLRSNPFEEITVTGIDLRTRVDDDTPAVTEIRAVRVEGEDGVPEPVDPGGGVIQTAGKLVRVEVDLRGRRQEPRTVRFAIPLPLEQQGFGTAEVRGGPTYHDPWECLWDPQTCVGDEEAGVAGLLQELAARPRNDELVGLLHVDPSSGDGEPPDGPDEPHPEAEDEVRLSNGEEPEVDTIETNRLRLDQVVRGSASFAVLIEPGRMPTTATACPPDEHAATPFVDVQGTSHEVTIACLYRREIVQGVAPDRFDPQAPVRRGQLATMLVQTLEAGGTPLSDAPPAGFTDTQGDVHAAAIDAVVAAGILQGTTTTTFAPDLPVTRGQLATAVVRAAELARGTQLVGADEWFVDIDGSVHRDHINAAAEATLVVGARPGRYLPSQQVQRAQVTAVLARLLDQLLVEENGGIGPPAAP